MRKKRTYGDALIEDAKSDYPYILGDTDNAYNGYIGQIAVTNAIKELTKECKRRTDMMEGFYSVMVKAADSLEKIETNLDELNTSVEELRTTIYYKD